MSHIILKLNVKYKPHCQCTVVQFDQIILKCQNIHDFVAVKKLRALTSVLAGSSLQYHVISDHAVATGSIISMSIHLSL